MNTPRSDPARQESPMLEDEQASLLANNTADATYGAASHSPPATSEPSYRQGNPDTDHNDVVDNDNDQDDNRTEAPSVLTSIVHDGMEVLTEVAEGVQHAVVEVVEVVEHVVLDIGEELQNTVVEILAPEEEEDTPAEDEAFSMQLTRGTSILPSDIAQAAAAFDDTMKHPADEEEALGDGYAEPESIAIPLSAYVMLAMAVIGLSSIGPLLDLQDGVSATIKIIWRAQATAILLLPFVAFGIHEQGLPSLTSAQVIITITAAACYASMCVLFAWSLDYTTVGNAVILSNCQAILLLIGKAAMGEAVTAAEGIGAITAFGGAIFCSRDSADTIDTSQTGNFTIVGDLYALLSAISGVLYLITAKTVRPTMNLYLFMFVIMFLGTLCGIGYTFIDGSKITFDRHVDHGVFGWMHWDMDRLPVELIMVVACNILGAMGYVRCMHYFSNLVIAVATLLEPVVAEITAVILGVGVLPGWMGWLGNALVLIGTLTVVYRPNSSSGKTLEH